MGCLSCGRGFHSECERGCKQCHADVTQIVKTITVGGGIREGVGPPVKDSKDVKDRFSTGRKRAAALYPIIEGSPCEWRGKKNCGGGLEPITGCIDGVQEHCHHGPVKDTLRNEPGNVHRICTKCHNRWHARNNSIYEFLVYNELPHRPEPATETELLLNETEWKLKLK